MNKITLSMILVVFSVICGHAIGGDHQESRRLMQQGEILPLQQILDRIGEERTGRVLEVELEQEDGVFIYDIELLGEDGRVWEYEVDAASGDILKREREE